MIESGKCPYCGARYGLYERNDCCDDLRAHLALVAAACDDDPGEDGEVACAHARVEEQPGEPPIDVCVDCGRVFR